MSADYINERQKALLDSFYHKKDQELIEKLKGDMAAAKAREMISQATGITDAAALDKLMDLELSPDTVAALYLVPLVEVAWADGDVDDKERQAILSGAVQHGVNEDGPAHALLKGWLDERPSADHIAAWKSYVQALGQTLDGDAMQRLRDDILKLAESVAAAAGGILGLGSKVSSSEKAVLDDLRKVLD